MQVPDNHHTVMKITISPDGPYKVKGSIPLVSKVQVVSGHVEPIAWKKEAEIAVGEEYSLCRCGKSGSMPFCDGVHTEIGFDGTENAPTNMSEERRMEFSGSTQIIIFCDPVLCSESGFCGNDATNIEELAKKSEDIQARTQAIGMIEHCPSGALTYRFEGEEDDNEVDLPKQIAVTTEFTSEGPIQGPFWVTGGIPIERADGKPFETRNRVTLCNCGQSQFKPLCDGTHRTYLTGK